MIIDANDFDGSRLDADLCIIGAGAAGISLARELIGQPIKVVLLEGGGYQTESESQALYKGEIVGNPYFPLEVVRLRQFGGSTGHWGGASWPLEAIDFEQRDWVPNSGWPVSRQQLDPYYKRAQQIIGLGPYNYSAKDWSDKNVNPLLRLENSGLLSKFYQSSSPPKRFGEAFRKEIMDAENINTLLHANVVRIHHQVGGQKIDHVKVRTGKGRDFSVQAKYFVLAVGGLENPRLLLQSNDVHTKGIGNQNDLVGRYFMEHIFVPSAKILLDKKINMEFYTTHKARGTTIRGGLGLSESILKSERIMNCWLGLGLKGAPPMPKFDGRKASPEDASAPQIGLNNMLVFGNEMLIRDRKISQGMGFRVIDVNSYAEQSPNPVSRVLLAKEKDRLGMQKIQLDWRLTDFDRKSVRQAVELFGKALGASNAGRLDVVLDGAEDSWSDPKKISKISWPFGSYHHMGTTRMHESPKKGVVDADCRVHGVKNLYIAGSSVFPTSGFANPTLTIIALVCRLADKLKKELA